MAKKPTAKPTTKKQEPPTAPKRRVPLGKAIVHTDEELDALSQITDADIEAAMALVESASPKLAGMLNAKPKGDNAEPTAPPPEPANP